MKVYIPNLTESLKTRIESMLEVMQNNMIEQHDFQLLDTSAHETLYLLDCVFTEDDDNVCFAVDVYRAVSAINDLINA